MPKERPYIGTSTLIGDGAQADAYDSLVPGRGVEVLRGQHAQLITCQMTEAPIVLGRLFELGRDGIWVFQDPKGFHSHLSPLADGASWLYTAPPYQSPEAAIRKVCDRDERRLRKCTYSDQVCFGADNTLDRTQAFQDPAISSYHFRVGLTVSGGVQVSDLGSTNGTAICIKDCTTAFKHPHNRLLHFPQGAVGKVKDQLDLVQAVLLGLMTGVSAGEDN